MKNQYRVSKPAYHLDKSWEYNFKQGPNFKGPFPPFPTKAKWKFLGHPVISPLGVAAGPLPSAKWMIPYLKLGYGSITQKTVRSAAHKSHPYPNITFVKKGQKVTLDQSPIIVENKVNGKVEDLTITNSFGNPSLAPTVWQKEAKKALKDKKSTQVFGISVYGTSSATTSIEQLAADYARCARMAKAAGAQYVEANLACPNVSGSENPYLYKDANSVAIIAKAMKKNLRTTPLVLKIGYFENYKNLLEVLQKSKGLFEGISAINTIQKIVVDSKGKPALPGRDVSGVCGAQIKKYALKTVKDLKKAQKDLKMKFEIIGVGGVMTPKDVNDFLKAGADHVHSATAVMFNPYLNYEFLQSVQN